MTSIMPDTLKYKHGVIMLDTLKYKHGVIILTHLNTSMEL